MFRFGGKPMLWLHSPPSNSFHRLRRPSMPLDHLAFDIETIPGKPFATYSESSQQIIQRKIDRQTEYDRDMTFDKFASLNADFGRIICISVGYVHNHELRLKSFCGDDERAILAEFNAVLALINGLFI